MAMQESEVPDNVTVQMQESEDDTHRYMSVEATVAGVPVIDHWKTPKAQRIRVVLPSSPDLLTSSYRIQPSTPTPAAKKPRYTGPSGSAGPSGVNRQLFFKVEEEDKEADEQEKEHEDKGGFILDEEVDQIDYQNEIPDTQDEEATFIRAWETANLLSIAQLGDIYLKTHKLTPKQADGVTDLLAVIDKVFDLDLCIQTIDDEEKATSDFRKAVARMKSGLMKEAWLQALEATRKASVRKQERQTTSMMGKLNHIDSTLTAIKVVTGTASYVEQRAVENIVKQNKVEEIKKVAEEKARQGEKRSTASYAQAAKKEEEGKKKVEEANQGLAEKKDKLQKLAQVLQAGPKPDEGVKISKEMGDLAREVKKDEETSWWGMSAEEAAQEG